MAKKKVKKKTSEESAVPFEESLNELEQIVGDLEAGDLGLSESLERYEQGVNHLKRCQTQLEQAERRIELLSGVDAQGNPVTAPFDATATDSPEGRAGKRTAASKPTKKKATTEDEPSVDDINRLF